jgi:beta-glucosidase
VPAVLLGWFSGQEFGHALADVLFGAVEPGGRLPTTWPAAEDGLPSPRPVDGVLTYAEGLRVGHRAGDPAAGPGGSTASGSGSGYAAAGFPFGHGLGYTTWEFVEAEYIEAEYVAGEHLAGEHAAGDRGGPAQRADATGSAAITGSAAAGGASRGGGPTLTVRIRNTGARRGRQVVQVYASRPDSAIARPVRWLAGYAAATVEPGATAAVAVRLWSRAFEHWDVAAGRWAVEPGVFTLAAGPSSADLPLSVDAPAH